MNWTQPTLEAVARLVNQRTGLSFANRQDSAESGIRRAMTKMRAQDAAAYLDRITVDDDALDDLVNELTVGETYFFREPAHFQFIAQTVLPDLQQRRGSGHPVRAWSAGCATGEEPYSLAILFEQQGLADHVQLAATDISRSALGKARQAQFSAWSLRGPSAEAALPYLTQQGNAYHLHEHIRQRVRFFHLNLALDAYPSFATGLWSMDLILCRNVLIYFDRDTIRKVALRLHQTLAEGGWLITSSSDPPLWEDAPFEFVARDEGVFYRRQGEFAAPAMIEPASAASWEREAWEGEAPAEPSSVVSADTREVTSFAPLDRLAEAGGALARGDYQRVIALTGAFLEHEADAVLRVRALANIDIAAAADACTEASKRHPLCAELHYLRAVLALDLGRSDEGAEALRRVLYLDRTLAVAHFTLGTILRQRGDRAGARRAYRNARDLCAARPADEMVPLADREPAGRLAEIAGAELALLKEP